MCVRSVIIKRRYISYVHPEVRNKGKVCTSMWELCIRRERTTNVRCVVKPLVLRAAWGLTFGLRTRRERPQMWTMWINFQQSGTLEDPCAESPRKKKRSSMCYTCEKAFFDSQDLKIHVQRVHETRKYHQCTLCHAAFFFSEELRIHVQRVHEKIKAHQCSHCKKAYFTSCHLRRHIRSMHEAEK